MSVALPASIVDNAQSSELKATLVGQIARALTIYSVDEVVIFEDRPDAPKSAEGVSKGLAFFVRNLQYLETPQYLRRQLLPVHRDLKWVGLLNPLDAPHHLRKQERLPYREGAVMEEEWDPPAGEREPGCWVNVGMDKPAWVSGAEIPKSTRVTVKLRGGAAGTEKTGGTVEELDESEHYWGVPVEPREPTMELGLYWGYQTRIASSLHAVFDECPYEGGYDLTIGTSERGEALGVSKVPKFKHLLLAFGGVGGLEESVSDSSVDPSTLFSRYVNVCPDQTSRTIRTEEALLISLAALRPYLPER